MVSVRHRRYQKISSLDGYIWFLKDFLVLDQDAIQRLWIADVQLHALLNLRL